MASSIRHGVAGLFRRIRSTDRKRVAVVVTTAATTTLVVASVATRKWRLQHLQDLALAQDVMDPDYPKLLASNATRASLMRPSIPGAKSVKEELDKIRSWHQDHGFRGGLVLRELTQPLFGKEDSDDSSSTMHDDWHARPLLLHQRECYYLYYEIHGNGHVRQQIYCRGTTLRADVWTCLQSWFVWDDELQCKLHYGFKSHADRLLQDVEPLLHPPNDARATVELCGHSLGGAVAYLVAMKLKKRGYNVVRVTSVGAPRVCQKEAVQLVQKYLPPISIRIEDDCDPVPYLPPFGAAPLGDKLWFVSSGKTPLPARYVPFLNQSSPAPTWVDSVWINFQLLETLRAMPERHRVPNYVERLNELADEMDKKQ